MKSKTRKAAGKASLDPLVRCRAWGPECDRFKGTDGCWHGKDHKRDKMCDTHCSFRDSKTICAPNNAVRGAAEPRTLDGLVGQSESKGA